MKKITIIIAVVLTLNINSYSQITSFGLEGMKVMDLKLHEGTLYAGTIDSGLFSWDLEDTEWVCRGLKGKNIWCVYPHKEDSQGYSLTAGIYNTGRPGDTTIIYSLSPYGWVADDLRVGYKPLVAAVFSIDGFLSHGKTDLMFAVGMLDAGVLLKRSNIIWKRLLEGNPLNILKISPVGEIWIGGQDGWGYPFLTKSTDSGNTWEEMNIVWHYNIGPSIRDIVFHPYDPDIVYIAEPTIQKTTNGGLNWDTLGISAEAIAIDPFNGDHIFAGCCFSDYFLLRETTDGGINWQIIPPPEGVKGIVDLEIIIRDSLELYIATFGTGVHRLVQPTQAIGRMLAVHSGWNMVSIPNKVNDFEKISLFPSSISSAFTYNGTYTPEETLHIGKGYWLKFSSEDKFYLIGEKIVLDTFDVNAGWNMIGSISYPVVVSAIASEPPGMITTNFFTYKEDRYVTSDTIKPGIAYWVKTNQSGKLILDTAQTQNYKLLKNSVIRITPTDESPPPPPNSEIRNSKSEISSKFALKQNYPNPFNPTTTIQFDIPKASFVTLKVYDVLGREVATLINEQKSAGSYNYEFRTSSASGGFELSSGVYFYRLDAMSTTEPTRKFTEIKKMVVVR